VGVHRCVETDGLVSTHERRILRRHLEAAEVKEHLAGFYLVDCETEARAVQVASRVPDAVWGLVEVRPVLDMSGWDL
jgi:hypothetical protein